MGIRYKVNLSDVDVIHSFTVPCLEFKIEYVPVRLSSCVSVYLLVSLYGHCSELCGSLHGFMLNRCYVVSQVLVLGLGLT